MKLTNQLTAAALLLVMCSCANTNLQGKKGLIGAGAGAGAGAIAGQAIGRNTEATLIGAAVGTMLGYIVGTEFDKYDARMMNQTLEKKPSGEPVSWQNPDSGNRYEMVAQPAVTKNGTVYRDATIKAVIDGKEEIIHTTAKRSADGTWKLNV